MAEYEGMGRFERWLARQKDDPGGRNFRIATVEVLDTAAGVVLWFDDQKLKPTAADVVQMTALVMAREVERERRETLP